MTEFHIHVDARTLGAEVERTLVAEHGFDPTDFSGHPPGIVHFEPNHHLTLKLRDGREFRERFDRASAYLKSTSIVGYLEGEHIASDLDIPTKPFDAVVAPLSLRLTLEQLPCGTFRETEIHVTMDRDRSDPRLIEILCKTGMFAAYLPKVYGTAVVFTVQGDRRTIAQLLPVITDYLMAAGGSVGGSIKEERVICWWLSGDDIELPPVVREATT